ncbi:MAG: exosome complex protein Rrp42 [Candidatus Aenigmarchaeota archaeon]|nr:exosome complex protein Rrp42 [Candidatus Aenigmarchaeota archaeon]
MALVRRVVAGGERLDQRKFDEMREIKIETGIISSAEGSARVTIGETEVIAGVKMAVGEPFPDTADEGVLIVSGEFIPFADPLFEPGPPREDAIELSRLVDRAIRESKAVDMKKLCITAGEKVWMINIDIDIINNGGNMVDASSIAAAAALVTARLPEIDEKGKVLYGKLTGTKLPLSGIPISTTFVKIGESIMIDPSLPEYQALDARLTIGTVDKNGIKLCSMQKNGVAGLSIDEVERMISVAEEKGEEVRQLVRDAAK